MRCAPHSLWGATTRRAKPRYKVFSVLREERPPAGPFLNDQKGAKESVKEGDFDFPLLDNPPLETTKHRGAAAPLLDVPLESSIAASLAPSAYSVTPPVLGRRGGLRPPATPPLSPKPKRTLPMAAPAWRLLFDRPIVTGRKRLFRTRSGAIPKFFLVLFLSRKRTISTGRSRRGPCRPG